MAKVLDVAGDLSRDDRSRDRRLLEYFRRSPESDRDRRSLDLDRDWFRSRRLGLSDVDRRLLGEEEGFRGERDRFSDLERERRPRDRDRPLELDRERAIILFFVDQIDQNRKSDSGVC